MATINPLSSLSINSSGPAATLAPSSYTDLTGLQNIRVLGNKNQSAALKEMAKQFESIFINMMVKSMRDANAAFEEGSMFQSNEMQFYRDMMDNELALHMSKGNGIGLADSFYKQMLRQYEVSESDEAMEKPKEDIGVSENKPIKVTASDSESDWNAAVADTKRQAPVDSETVHSADKVEFSGQKDFIETLLPYAKWAAKKLGVNPAVLIAQSALETGWGKYLIQSSTGSSSFNLFNIKANSGWEGEKIPVNSLEYRDGAVQPERSNFRKYQNFSESIQDYVELIQGQDRYRGALNNSENSNSYVNELQKAGYATDPEYANKIIRLLDSDIIQDAVGP